MYLMKNSGIVAQNPKCNDVLCMSCENYFFAQQIPLRVFANKRSVNTRQTASPDDSYIISNLKL
ncbi:unnamed protein product [Medioppia subpectinata]|uniref:Uncharacterized protein n=1 Tax=Medioppia subpectinata TaxID=1979941 RepID=A0A7R9KNL3_9ACAR|nr:unnamed protein product [Medioppia subpectinata]CAG2106917.1 unnamed protein product [Medioppia subpectinata]